MSRSEASRRHFELSSMSDFAYGNEVELTTVGGHTVVGTVAKLGSDCLIVCSDDNTVSAVSERWLVGLKVLAASQNKESPVIPELLQGKNVNLVVALERMAKSRIPMALFDIAGHRTVITGWALVGEDNLIYTNQHLTAMHRLNSLAVISLLLPPKT
jgi:hypothetical protein